MKDAPYSETGNPQDASNNWGATVLDPQAGSNPNTHLQQGLSSSQVPFHPGSLPHALNANQTQAEQRQTNPGPARPQAGAAIGMTTLTGKRSTVLPEVDIDSGEVILRQKNTERYDNLKHLGEGGAGEVVLVHDNDIRRKVAMKRIKKEVLNNVQMARFIEEIRTIGQLDHPNIIPVHDVGVDEKGQHYFTMKFVQGETLADVIKKLRNGDKEYHKRYTFERRTQIFVEILQAIRFAHNRGIIHRDLKPENIMIGEYNEVIVMDWGIAKQIRPNPFAEKEQFSNKHKKSQEFIESLQSELEAMEQPAEASPFSTEQRVFQTQHGAIIGTPAYMAPEQVLGQKDMIDERTDLYSLNVLFYEFLNLKHPLEHKTSLQDMLFGVLHEDAVDSEKQSNPHQGPVPRELCFFLRKGLKKKPAERFQHVDDMIEELQANLEGRICVYCPSTFLKRSSHMTGHFMDNHRFQGPIYAGLLLIVLGIGFWQTAVLLMGLFS